MSHQFYSLSSYRGGIISTVSSLAITILVCSCCSRFSNAQTGAPPERVTCAVFPQDNVWNTPVDNLPVDANSAAYIASIGAETGMHPDFASAPWRGHPIGIPYALVPGTQPKVRASFRYSEESDPGPYPIPPNVPIEGGADSKGDRHVTVIDKDNCILYELYGASPKGDGNWTAASGAIFDLKSNKLRKLGWTSADAAGLPVFAGLVRYDEAATGEIRHALRFTAPKTRKDYVWPATHFASRFADSQYPPMGQRFRLKASFDISGFSREVQAILKALKKYGMFLADNGGPWFLSGTPDPRWDDNQTHELRRVHGSDFEAVDEFSLRADSRSGQVKH